MVQTRRFAATYANISVLLDFVAQAARMAGFDSAAVDDIQLAVCEACSNIIRHGYRKEGAGDIACTCSMHTEAFQVILRDQAMPFNLLAAPVRAPVEQTQQFIPGGWGIFLIRHFMHEVRYHQETEATNVLVLIKHKHNRTGAEFKMATKTIIQGVTVLAIQGAVTISNGAVEMRKAVYDEAVNGDAKKILLNLQGVTVMDSNGLAELMGCHAMTQGRGGALKLCNLPPKVQSLMTVTRLINVFDIYENQDKAIASFT